MAINAIDSTTYTYADYIKYTEDDIVEIIDGRILSMPPVPSRIHQKIILKISTQIENYITSNNGSCEVYTAPFDVILKNDDEEISSSKNIVQPDISVICDKNEFRHFHLEFTLEYLIPITLQHQFRLYLKSYLILLIFHLLQEKMVQNNFEYKADCSFFHKAVLNVSL